MPDVKVLAGTNKKPASKASKYFIFMTEGFLIFLPQSLLTKGWNRPSLVKLHWLLQVLGFCCIALGLIAVVTIKIIKGNPHFSFPHSITGLVAIIMAACTGIGGYVSRLKPHPKGPSLAQIKLGHVFFGMASYVVGVAALVLGYFTSYFGKLVDYEWRLFIAVITVLVSTVAFVNASVGFYRRAKNLFNF
ncbi:transmembrane reductase CYB561D2 [Neocloeon triangulifer]|uniref:transmembrane reductase CYB561D2 n=1 Tax=Neocloeon triangulifer TaxID=2078957 RepID=UPI00286EEFE5|nr:transmembrane reductase CYB561D2 [Neocloeon triangulifer]